MGSPHFRSVETSSVCVTEAWFPPGAVLHPHVHARGIFATMLDGSFETSILGRRLECTPATIWTEPAEERHANAVGRRGARALVLQLDPRRAEEVLPFDAVSRGVLHLRHAGIALTARRLTRELDVADEFTPLVVDAVAVEMIVAAARHAEARRRYHRRSPSWLSRVQEILHDASPAPQRLDDIASAVGEPPWRVAREFRRCFGTSIGEYARSLRLTWALQRLATTSRPISEIAHAAGYADQSHLTRACTSAVGVGPAEFRRRSSGCTSPPAAPAARSKRG